MDQRGKKEVVVPLQAMLASRDLQQIKKARGGSPLPSAGRLTKGRSQ
jgi:hypothetical protein